MSRKSKKDQAAYMKAYHEGRRDEYYLRKYGITLADYNALLEKQGGVCAICEGIGKRRLSVDHCHTTGRVRGLLCGSCNRALGYFKDEVRLLTRATSYLDAL